MEDIVSNLFTKRLGNISEKLIKHYFSLSNPDSIYYDWCLGREKIEVKSSKALLKYEVKNSNLLEKAINQNNNRPKLASIKHYDDSKFDCNLQQIKPYCFDTMFYILYFQECALIFRASSKEIENWEGYCDKQHKGNKDEGQYHVKSHNLKEHLNNHLLFSLTTKEVQQILGEIKLTT